MNRLRDKVAFVTGTTKPIGEMIALRFAEEGAFVVGVGRDVARGRGLCDRISKQDGEYDFIACDLKDVAALERGLQTFGRFGGVDIVVNNAAAIDIADATSRPPAAHAIPHRPVSEDDSNSLAPESTACISLSLK